MYETAQSTNIVVINPITKIKTNPKSLCFIDSNFIVYTTACTPPKNERDSPKIQDTVPTGLTINEHSVDPAEFVQ